MQTASKQEEIKNTWDDCHWLLNLLDCRGCRLHYLTLFSHFIVKEFYAEVKVSSTIQGNPLLLLIVHVYIKFKNHNNEYKKYSMEIHVHVDVQYPSIKSFSKVNIVRLIYALYNAPYHSKVLYVHHLDGVVFCVYWYFL